MLRDNLAKCFAVWLAEIRRADEAQDGRAYLAMPVLEAIAAGCMPPSAGEEKQANGWMKHDGGERPVTIDAKVQVRQRDGSLLAPCMARHLYWSHLGRGADIMEYREVGHD